MLSPVLVGTLEVEDKPGMIWDLCPWGPGGDKAAGECYDAAEILKLMGSWRGVPAYECMCLCACVCVSVCCS